MYAVQNQLTLFFPERIQFYCRGCFQFPAVLEEECNKDKPKWENALIIDIAKAAHEHVLLTTIIEKQSSV
jgi:hypothetical protein